jgi:hypothetical protein
MKNCIIEELSSAGTATFSLYPIAIPQTFVPLSKISALEIP